MSEWLPILPSKILAHCARRLPRDGERFFGYDPLLLETLVDSKRFADVM